jgi:hypothetical protein
MEQPPDDDLFGLLAQFETPEQLVAAAGRARAAGYRKVEGYCPFPVHGLDEALGRPRSGIPLLVLAGGFTGAIIAYSLEYYCSAVGYKINIGGRPLNSWPQFMPVVFELTVLGASFAAFFGSMILNGLPQPYHPLFNVPNFKLASQNRFFLSIETDDPQFHLTETRQFLESLPAEHVFEVPK